MPHPPEHDRHEPLPTLALGHATGDELAYTPLLHVH